MTKPLNKKPTLYPCTEKGCTVPPFKYATGLGAHKRSAHGILGMSKSSVAARQAKEAGKADTTTPQAIVKSVAAKPTKTAPMKTVAVKPLVTKPNHALVLPSAQNVLRKTVSEQTRELFASRLEAAATIARGTMEGMCRSLALQFGLPERMLSDHLGFSAKGQYITEVE